MQFLLRDITDVTSSQRGAADASVALEGAVGCTVYVCLIISLTAARVLRFA